MPAIINFICVCDDRVSQFAIIFKIRQDDKFYLRESYYVQEIISFNFFCFVIGFSQWCFGRTAGGMAEPGYRYNRRQRSRD
jgi:hypothetical protein